MEARSLSSLNFLAANPPQYPTRPNEEKVDDLTLYILRVPGTRGEEPSIAQLRGPVFPVRD